jgi:MFS family permease
VLVANALLSSALLAACAAFTPDTPIPMIMAILLIGGFLRSLEFTSITTIAYADLSPRLMSRATSLTAAAQQVSLSMGVAVGALAVEVMLRLEQQPVISAADFPPAFLLVAAISACSTFVFWRLPADAGAELADRTPAPNETSDQRVG